MTKAYEKDKRFVETEKERGIPFHQTPSPPTTAVNDNDKSLGSATNKNCHSEEKTRNVQTAYRKTVKIQKNWDRQSTEHPERRYSLRSST